MNFQIGVLLFIFIAFIITILTGKVKIHVAAIMIPILLELTGILKTSEAWAGFTNSSVIMMASMFVVGAGLGKTDILQKLSGAVIKPGSSDFKIMLGLCIPVLFLGLVVNSTAALTILLPLIASICKEQNRPISKFAYPITIFAVITVGIVPIGGNAGAYLGYNTIVENLGGVGTWEYFTMTIAKLPFAIAIALLMLFLGPKFAPEKAAHEGTISAGKGIKQRSLPVQKQKVATGIFLATVIGVIVCALLKVNTWYPAMVGAIAMVLSGVLSDREAIAAMGSPIIFIFVGTLPLSTALKSTGADVLISDWFNSVFGGSSPWVIMMAMYLLCFALTQFISNSAVSTAFRVLTALIAVQGGYDARAMMLAAMLGSSNCFLLPTAGPATVMGYEAGGYDMKQYIKQGILPTIIHAVIFAIYIPFMFPLK